MPPCSPTPPAMTVHLEWHEIVQLQGRTSSSSLFEASSSVHDGDSHFKWRLTSREIGNRVFWEDRLSDAEVRGPGVHAFPTLEEMQADCQRREDQLVADLIADYEANPPESDE